MQYDTLAQYTDDELQNELKERVIQRKQRLEEILYFSEDLGVICEVSIERESWHDAGQEYFYVLNGGWYGTREDDNFVIHGPSGDKVRTVTDWIEVTRADLSKIPEEYRRYV